MDLGHFYDISEEYYRKFPNCGLMVNKTADTKGNHDRPCLCCHKEDGIYWMVPISSKIEKYKKIYNHGKAKYRNYDGIRFGYVKGDYRAFLIQNVFPVTERYIMHQYKIQNHTVPVTIKSTLEQEITRIVKKAILMNAKGIKIIMTNINKMNKELQKELWVDKSLAEIRTERNMLRQENNEEASLER